MFKLLDDFVWSVGLIVVVCGALYALAYLRSGR